MIALRLVLDTNVLVSAALKREGLQRTGFLLSITPPARLFVSAPILEEYGRVLVRRELGIGKGARLQLLQLIKNRSRLVAPQRRLEVTRDRDDNIFLECAEASRTDYLITGNLRLSRGTGSRLRS